MIESTNEVNRSKDYGKYHRSRGDLGDLGDPIEYDKVISDAGFKHCDTIVTSSWLLKDHMESSSTGVGPYTISDLDNLHEILLA